MLARDVFRAISVTQLSPSNSLTHSLTHSQMLCPRAGGCNMTPFDDLFFLHSPSVAALSGFQCEVNSCTSGKGQQHFGHIKLGAATVLKDAD